MGLNRSILETRKKVFWKGLFFVALRVVRNSFLSLDANLRKGRVTVGKEKGKTGSCANWYV
jgi:hypothetical protein